MALGWCGEQLTSQSSSVAAFWPPTGWIVALLVVLPRRFRLWVVAAILPGDLISDSLQGGFAPQVALGWSVADILGAVLAAWVMLRIAGVRPRGGRARDFVALAAAAICAPAVSGLVGSAVSVAAFGGQYGLQWLDWWLGDMTGIMLVVPVVLSLAHAGRLGTPVHHLIGLLEVGLVICVAIATFAFTKQAVEFLVLPPLVLLAVRQGLRLTAVASLSMAAVATVCTARGLGPLSDTTVGTLELQAFIMTTAFVAFLICATMSERKHAEVTLADIAMRDPLTGLANRRWFMQQLNDVSARHDRSSESAAVIYIDLDRFKETNDRLGHAAGDAVLVETGRRLTAAVRDGDLVARIGGDEFAAILKPVDGLSGAELSARRIADAIEHPFAVGDDSIPMDVSVGVSLAGSDSELALREADERQYRDKQVSRSSVVALSAVSRG